MTEPRLPLEVTPNLRDLGDCGCGCGAYGTLKRPSADGTRCVQRVCRCKRCVGRMNRSRGLNKQRAATRKLGLSHGQYAGTHEEALQGPVRTEHKSTARSAGPVATAYELTRAQAEAARAFGDNRPFVASFTPPKSTHIYFVVRDDDLEAFVSAYIETWGTAS